MHLPQELVDHIVDFLHDDPIALAQASLVSRALLGRTRSYLCETLKITRSKVLSSNPSHLLPLCGYVKVLHYTWPESPIWSGGPFSANPHLVLDCFEQSEPHTLALHSYGLTSLNEQIMKRPFAKFPCASIAILELHEISLPHRVFPPFLSLFPNVDDLKISTSQWQEGMWGGDHDAIVEHTSPPRLRGSFKLLDLPGDEYRGSYHGKILHTLATLPLYFQTVSLDVRGQPREAISAFLNSCSGTVRKVFVGHSDSGYPTDWPPISDFANLEELHIGVSGTDEILSKHTHSLLQSVTSSHLRRVIIGIRKQEIAAVRWTSLDENLASLIKRHKGCRNLALQISTKADPEKIRVFLPQAAQTGVLKVGFIEGLGCWA